MDEAHKELVKRLRGGRCPQCFGFGEVSYGGELVRCSCRDKYEAPISMEHRKAAADALEALAGEVEKAREYAADLRLRAKEAADARVYCAAKLTAAEAERDRLKMEVVKWKSRVPPEMDGRAILFEACPTGHGSLRGENWVKHDCVICERDRLKAALDWYADENNWRDQPILRMDHLGRECEDLSPAEIWGDNGDRARKALGDAS